ncbi:unnamed protein product [Phytophthora fragariaefolia]|uniref:Unnamed protein product n=1 Tax=Phytophthora fragariaefolia TaxID=1490495 RepID=A0A9W6Y6A8_9STRA|nr:unnamed protein product [Phytophthora fragariaefolia]
MWKTPRVPTSSREDDPEVVDAVAATVADEVAGTVGLIVRTVVAEAGPDTAVCVLEQAISSSDDCERSRAVPDIQANIQACVVNGDSNLMTAGAAECTGLNSYEDLDLHEEAEDEEDDPSDSWEEDWEIGQLTDEGSDVELEELPESVLSSAVTDASFITSMRDNEWEYGKLC